MLRLYLVVLVVLALLCRVNGNVLRGKNVHSNREDDGGTLAEAVTKKVLSHLSISSSVHIQGKDIFGRHLQNEEMTTNKNETRQISDASSSSSTATEKPSLPMAIVFTIIGVVVGIVLLVLGIVFCRLRYYHNRSPQFNKIHSTTTDSEDQSPQSTSIATSTCTSSLCTWLLCLNGSTGSSKSARAVVVLPSVNPPIQPPNSIHNNHMSQHNGLAIFSPRTTPIGGMPTASICLDQTTNTFRSTHNTTTTNINNHPTRHSIRRHHK